MHSIKSKSPWCHISVVRRICSNCLQRFSNFAASSARQPRELPPFGVQRTAPLNITGIFLNRYALEQYVKSGALRRATISRIRALLMKKVELKALIMSLLADSEASLLNRPIDIANRAITLVS